MANTNHDEIGAGDIHIPYNLTYPDATNRIAGTNEGSSITVTSANLGQLAKQDDDDTLWMLTGVGPITWLQITTGGASTDTIDDNYNNYGANPANVTIDNAEGQGDLKFLPTGAFSLVADISGCTGAADGFQILNGSDEVTILNTAANEIGAAFNVDDFSVVSESGFQLGGGAASGIATTAANLSIITATSGTMLLDAVAILDIDVGSNLDIDVTNSYTLDANSFALTAAAASSLTVTGNNPLTLQTTGYPNGGGGVINIISYSALDMDCGSGTWDATAGISLDAAQASNFTVSGASADLTLGARGATITVNESGQTTFPTTSQSITGAVAELNTAVQYKTGSLHAASEHENGGALEISVVGLSGELADAQPVAVSKNSGATVGTRSTLNFIEGSNVTLTVADDAGGDEVDITITAASGGGDFSDGGDVAGADRTLGNTDNYDLGLITNNLNRLHIENGGNIGVGTTSPNASALMDMSSTTKGFRPPQMTTTQRNAISSPATGLIIYNTTTNTQQRYNGSKWTESRTMFRAGEDMNTKTGTFNGLSCSGASSATINTLWGSRGYSDGSGSCSNTVFVLPDNYVNDSNIVIELHWSAFDNSGNVFWGIGFEVVGNGDAIQNSGTYRTGTSAAPGTSGDKTSYTDTFTGTGYSAGELLSVLVYRDGANGSDTLADTVYLLGVEITYEVI